MPYRFAYPNAGVATGGYGVDPAMMAAAYPNMHNEHRRSYSPESFSSDTESSDDYEYRGRMVTRESRHPQDVVRAPTPPPIIKRVVERAPTPEAPIMERVIIRPQAQEIVERVIEQPRTPPPRIIQKEMHEEAPPPIVRTRVIKVDRPVRSGFSQPGSPFGQPYSGLPSLSNGMLNACNPYRAQSIAGSIGQPAGFPNVLDNNDSFSSSSSFDYAAPEPIPSEMMRMTMPQAPQPMTMMQPQQQMMYRPFQMQASMPPPRLPSTFMPHNIPYQMPHTGMSFGYRPMMQPGRMISSGMPMMATMNPFGVPPNTFQSQPTFYPPVPQQLVY